MDDKSGPVRWIGEMRRVMRGGDLSGRAPLQPFAKMPHVYALGPLEGLKGEVTIWDGTPYISRVQDHVPVVEKTFALKACFLVYAQVTAWQKVAVPGSVRTLSDFETFLIRTAAAKKIDQTRPFPFLLTGTPRKAVYHIVHKTDTKPHTFADHDRIKVHFAIENQPVRLLGFWSDKHAGIFTHHDTTIHTHLITADEKQAGHLESLLLAGDVSLSLPR
jgi:acetolactate decarboxylase